MAQRHPASSEHHLVKAEHHSAAHHAAEAPAPPPPPPPPPAAPAAPPREQSRFGQFIQNYSSFLSSFVIGAAGLIATTQYQWNQSKMAAKQAESQIHITQTQADNNWKIERAKILSQNLQVLAAQGSGNVEQRYGVLLSLTRGNILDPELAVSYALELGKENPDYMHSVLSNTQEKDYRRLANAFAVTCEQRYGIARPVDLCKGDKQQDRSAALAELVSEESETNLAQGKPGPLVILRDDREVQANLTRLLWLFTPFLNDLYERRQWEELERFASFSAAARLVAALAVLSVNDDVFVSNGESSQLRRFHDSQRRFLRSYLLGCDGECRGRVLSVMLSAFRRAGGDFDDAMIAVLSRPRAEIAGALSRLNQRLLLCQVSDGDAAALRDQVLVPLLQSTLRATPVDADRVDDLLGLLAQVPEPPAPAPAVKDPAGKDVKPAARPDSNTAPGRWLILQEQLQQVEGGRYLKALGERRTQRQRAQRSLPVALRKANFCNVSAGNAESLVTDE